MVDNDQISKSNKSVPASYKRSAKIEKWDDFGHYRQNVMILAWSNATEATRIKIISNYL